MQTRLLAAAALIIAATGSLSSVAQNIQVNKDNRTIAVTATDKATSDADVAMVSVGFSLFAPDAQSAYAQGSKLSNAIADALKHAGIPDKAMQSESQSLQRTEFGEGDKSTGQERAQKQFTLEQSWKVKAPAADAAQVLHIAIEAGANNSGHIDWELNDRNALEARAAEKALVRARAIAEQMAKGLNAHLGSLVYASNQVPYTGIQRAMMNSMAETVSVTNGASPPPPLAIKPQQIEESATVYAVFAIE